MSVARKKLSKREAKRLAKPRANRKPQPAALVAVGVSGRVQPDIGVADGGRAGQGQRPALKRAFLAAAVGALLELVDNAAEGTVSAALASPSAAGGLARFVAATVPASPGLAEVDPLAGSIARSAERKQTLLTRAGGVLGVSQVAKLLGITRQAVDKRRAAKQLLALRNASDDYQYPAIQFTDDGVIPNLREFLTVSGFDEPLMQLQLLLATPEPLGGHRVIDALAKGDPALVAAALDVARAAGDQGA